MLIQLIKRNDKNKIFLDCMSCNRKQRRCLLLMGKIELKGQIIKQEDCDVLEELVKKELGHGNLPLLDTFLYFDICPLPFVTDWTIDMLKTYNRLQGFGNIDFFTLERYPNILVESFDIIQREIKNGYE